MKKETKTIILNLALSPIIGLIGIALISVANTDSSLLIGLAIFLPVAIFLCIAFGYPLTIYLNAKHITGYMIYASIAAIVGTLFGFAISSVIFVSGSELFAVICFIYGACTGSAYVWLTNRSKAHNQALNLTGAKNAPPS